MKKCLSSVRVMAMLSVLVGSWVVVILRTEIARYPLWKAFRSLRFGR